LHTHVPDRLQPRMRLFVLLGDDQRRELTIDSVWPHKQYLVLKLAGIDSIDDAQVLVGHELQVPASERAPLEPGASYVSDLIGCVVMDRDCPIGTIQDVRFGAGEAPLLVVGSGKGELEIPYVQEFLVRVDLDRKRIDMLLPEGLLEVNAPLTEEEKQSLRGHSHERRKA
jgi:16S rRNA processing protein RimM